jgi:hypothetical protein
MAGRRDGMDRRHHLLDDVFIGSLASYAFVGAVLHQNLATAPSMKDLSGNALLRKQVELCRRSADQ